MKYNYQLHHVIISQIATVLMLWIGLNVFSFTVPVMFYGFRELWQYNNGIRHEEQFDWGGIVPVAVSQTLIAIIYHL
jgi:hypothetical protein